MIKLVYYVSYGHTWCLEVSNLGAWDRLGYLSLVWGHVHLLINLKEFLCRENGERAHVVRQMSRLVFMCIKSCKYVFKPLLELIIVVWIRIWLAKHNPRILFFTANTSGSLSLQVFVCLWSLWRLAPPSATLISLFHPARLAYWLNFRQLENTIVICDAN